MTLSTSYILRPWQKEDLSSMIQIETLVQPFPWSADIFTRLIETYHGWIIEEYATMIGFIVVSLDANEAHILNVCVHPEHQRQGYGKRLLTQALHYAVIHQAEKIVLEVRRSNAAAMLLYESLGFQKIGERKDYYTDGLHTEDAIVFAKKCL